ncbi:hypothetical protein ABDK00_014465 [Niabella insulamsoli]|uniref:hypothetical protein n=1 Tax=Niabella insulamsoli TaxID=3144874 RepID=UPI0031FD3FF9
MHDLEPYYNWQHIYVSEEDERSPFFGTEHSQFEYTDTVYNYYIHPQWDYFGSKTLYLKILMADYEEGYAIIEMIGEWNDAVENDIMTLKRDVLETFMQEGIYKFILIAENVLNFHSSDKEYYEELHEELSDEDGWIVCLNMPEQTQYEFRQAKLGQFIELMDIQNWRVYKPYHLFKKVDDILSARLGFSEE